MAIHKDFQEIKNRFVVQFGEQDGSTKYDKWLNKHGHDENKEFPKNKKGEKKEYICNVHGFEIKENNDSFHVYGLIATDHIDNLDRDPRISIPDVIPKETLESFAVQINDRFKSRIMGVHHSEGRPFVGEYFGVADVENTPAEVITLNDGHNGLYVDSKLLKDDPKTPEIIKEIRSGDLDAFSITYGTNGFETTDFDYVEDRLVRVLKPETRLDGYTLAGSRTAVNPNALMSGYGFKEFKELVGKGKEIKGEVLPMVEDNKKIEPPKAEEKPAKEAPKEEPVKKAEEKPSEEKPVGAEKVEIDAEEHKEFIKFKKSKEDEEMKEKIDGAVKKAVDNIELKEKVLKDVEAPSSESTVLPEIKEFYATLKEPSKVEIKEQFKRAGRAGAALGIDCITATTSRSESREYKHFTTNGRMLEFKGLGITTNQNTDTDYLQSSAELNDIYDPVIYNALNQATKTWNVLNKDDFSSKGNNQVQFKLKIAANDSAAFYTGNSVSTDKVGRLKYQTKFKKVQVGVSVDGDMIAAARGGPVSDVFAQEVMDSTMDMLAVVNAALYAEVGLETASAIIGFEYLTDSANNTTLYNLTRSTTNKLTPDSATDTYIDGNAANVTMDNLRKAYGQCELEGVDKSDLVFFTSPTQGRIMRGIMDDARRLSAPSDTSFGFTTDLYIDGIPVFEDKDCNSDDWWCVPLSTHRVAIWQPPTLEKLGKSADSDDAFIKMYFCTYNTLPRALVQIYGNSTSLI